MIEIRVTPLCKSVLIGSAVGNRRALLKLEGWCRDRHDAHITPGTQYNVQVSGKEVNTTDIKPFICQQDILNKGIHG